VRLYRSRRVLAFFALTFGFSWTCWTVVLIRGVDYLSASALPFFVAGSFGPLFAALVMRRVGRGERPPVLPTGRRFRWWVWLPAGLALGSVGALVASAATSALGESGVDLHVGAKAATAYGNPLAFLLVYLLLGPLSEEPGWRGWLYPRLRSRASVLRIGLTFGPIWTLWHLPLFLIAGTYQHSLGIFTIDGLLFLLSTTALAVVISYAYERLGGLWAGISVHFSSNTVSTVLGITSTAGMAWSTAAMVALAAILIATWPTTAPTTEEHAVNATNTAAAQSFSV
jgi:membrane protease YdiL (CAAX protease family)